MTDSDPSDFVCENCGRETRGPLIGGECMYKCSEAVPIEDLEELLEEWQESQDHMASQGVTEWADGIKECAQELREVIQDHE